MIGLRENEDNTIQKNRYGKAIKALAVILCILTIGAGVSIYKIYGILHDNSRSLFMQSEQTNRPVSAVKTSNNQTAKNTSGSQVSETQTATSQETIQYDGHVYSRNPNIVNLLFLGIDYTEERASLNLGYRSDMTLVCAVDTVTKKVTLISIPRDTYTTVYHLQANTGKVEYSEQNKINSAYEYGGGPKYRGAENSMACVKMFLQRQCTLKTPLDFTLDIPIYMYASIDIDGIAPVMTSVGGIEVTLDYNLPGVGRKGETVLLTGTKADTYIRDRDIDPNGDFGRITKEQAIMKKLAQKIKEMGAVNDILSLYSDLQKYVHTNLTTNQMVDFAKILSNVNLNSIQTYMIPGTGGSDKNGTYYYYPDEEKTLQLLLSVYYNQIS